MGDFGDLCREIAEDLRRAFGLAVRDLRQREGHTQAQFAAKAGISRATLRTIEAGKSDAHLSMMAQMAIALEMSLYRFYCEIENRRSTFTPHALHFESKILPGGILAIFRTGVIDISKEVAYLIEVYTHTKAQGIFKVLFDLSAAECNFSQREEYKVTREMMKWMKANSYFPVVSMVYNTTLGDFGVTVARDHGLVVGMFRSFPEALAWLEREPLTWCQPPAIPGWRFSV